jgi:hypothetical protein
MLRKEMCPWEIWSLGSQEYDMFHEEVIAGWLYETAIRQTPFTDSR